MNSYRFLLGFILCSSILLASCVTRKNEPVPLFMDFRVSGNEDDSIVVVKIQFREDGPFGSVISAGETSKVELDGAVIKPDSSSIGGIYYEVIRPLSEFTGKHNIVFTDSKNTSIREEFEFKQIRFKNQLNDTIHREDQFFEMEGLDETDQVRVVISDTASWNDEINRLDIVRKGRVRIFREDLEKLMDGPIHIEIYRESDNPISKAGQMIGQLSISYGLKRDLFLSN